MIGKIVGYPNLFGFLEFSNVIEFAFKVTLVFYSVENLGLCGFGEIYEFLRKRFRGFGLAN